jgi:hypothetical protein
MSGSGGGGSGGGAGQWVTVDNWTSLPPWASMVMKSAKPFSWRIYGANAPFLISGGPVVNTTQWVGWTLAYGRLDVQAQAPVQFTINAGL